MTSLHLLITLLRPHWLLIPIRDAPIQLQTPHSPFFSLYNHMVIIKLCIEIPIPDEELSNFMITIVISVKNRISDRFDTCKCVPNLLFYLSLMFPLQLWTWYFFFNDTQQICEILLRSFNLKYQRTWRERNNLKK